MLNVNMTKSNMVNMVSITPAKHPVISFSYIQLFI